MSLQPLGDIYPLRRRLVPRLNTAEVAALSRRHLVTVRRALEDGKLHGTQSIAVAVADPRGVLGRLD